jgi:beta-lactam-binding protein with PASTA domain
MTWRRATRRFLPYVVVAATGFAAAYLLVAFFVFPRQVAEDDAKVPNVVGSSYDQAVRDLEHSGFRAKRGEVRVQATVPPQTVLEQEPAGGTLEKKGTTVTLHVSSGERTSLVPMIIGKDAGDARVALLDAGLSIDSVVTTFSSAPIGTVIDSHPKPASQVAGSTRVTLIVSSGPALVAVPSLRGQTISQAAENLRRAGLVLGDVSIDSSARRSFPGSVLEQHPPAGERVPGGTQVSLRIAPEGPRTWSTD